MLLVFISEKKGGIINFVKKCGRNREDETDSSVVQFEQAGEVT